MTKFVKAYAYDPEHKMFIGTRPAEVNKDGSINLPKYSLAIPPALNKGKYYIANEDKSGWIEKDIPTSAEDIKDIKIRHQDTSQYANMIRSIMNSSNISAQNYQLKSEGEGANELRFLEKIPEPSFEDIQEQKLQEVQSKANSLLNYKNSNNYFESSLGFKVNGDTSSYDNLSSLENLLESSNNISTLDLTFLDEENNISFRTYADTYVSITKNDIKVLKEELQKNRLNILSQKWQLEQEVNNASSKEDLNNINIQYEMLSFLNN